MYDVDQILEQILPFFQPHVYIRIPIPELNSKFEAKVLFNSATPDTNPEFTDEEFRVIKYNLDFTVQTYMMKPVEESGLIKNIYLNFYTNDQTFDSRLSSSTFTSAASGESMKLYGPSANDPTIFKYEIYQFGRKIGTTITGEL